MLVRFNLVLYNIFARRYLVQLNILRNYTTDIYSENEGIGAAFVIKFHCGSFNALVVSMHDVFLFLLKILDTVNA